MKFLSPRVHGVLDFVFIATLLAGPTVLNLGGIPEFLSYAAGLGVLALVIVTRYPFGIFKVVPFPVHGGLEFVSSLGLVLSPWLFNFAIAEVARNYFVALGASLFAVWLCTNYRAADTARLYEREPRREEEVAGIR